MKSLILTICLIICMVPMALTAQNFLEEEGLLVIELESQEPTSAYAKESTESGYEGTGYFRSLFEIPTLGGFRKLTYSIRIRTGGTYQFAMRSRIGAGTSTDAANSCFVRIVDKDGIPVSPVANENVVIGDSWYAMRLNVLDAWSHEASNNDTDPRSLAWALEAGQQYFLETSVRSKDHLLDRLILWDRNLHALADPVTGNNPNETTFNTLAKSAQGSGWVYPGDLTVPADIYPLLDLIFSFQASIIEPFNNQGIIGWKHATFYTGVMWLYWATGDTKYLDYLTTISADNNWTMLEVNQALWRHADNHLMGETFINLYIEDGEREPLRVAHVTSIFDRMIAEPWDGRVLYKWCDALFMSPPVWAQLAALYGNDRYLQELDTLWWDAKDFLYNPEWNLYYRDASYFNSLEANGKPTFWGRGNGWVMGGLVRVLEYMRPDWPGRQAYVDQFREMSVRLASLQMESGGWSSSLLYPERYDFETEVSATSFFVYAIAWGINNGLLDKATYGPVAEKGWMEMSRYLTEEGGIQHIQSVGKEPGPVDDALTLREYGYGAYILAGVEMAEYYATGSGGNWLGYPTTEQDGQIWADTNGFMGWLEVSASPYAYSLSLAGWVYVAETENLVGKGSWVYIHR